MKMKGKIIQICKEIIKTINFFLLYVFWTILAYSAVNYVAFGKITTGLSVTIHDHNDK